MSSGESRRPHFWAPASDEKPRADQDWSHPTDPEVAGCVTSAGRGPAPEQAGLKPLALPGPLL